MSNEAVFAYDFPLDTKSIITSDDGAIWVEGLASDFDWDREDEAFEPGAFREGLKTFLATNPIMLFHHQYDNALGRFTEGRVDENGLWLRGRIDPPTRGSWAEDVVRKIRSGTIKSWSVGGIFHRRTDEQGRTRIYKCDLAEVSCTPLPINSRALFSVVGTKAFATGNALQIEPTTKDTIMRFTSIDPARKKAIDARARAEAVHRESETVDGLRHEGETVEVPLSAFFGLKGKRDRLGNPVIADPLFDDDPFVGDVPSEASLNALMGRPVYEKPGKTPEQILKEEASRSRLATITDRLQRTCSGEVGMSGDKITPPRITTRDVGLGGDEARGWQALAQAAVKARNEALRPGRLDELLSPEDAFRLAAEAEDDGSE